jgi:Membrane-fusion protein
LPKPHAPEPRKPWKWLILLAIVLIAGWAYYSNAKAKKDAAAANAALVIRTAKVTVGNLERTVRMSGQTSARNFANVTVPMLRGPEANRDMTLLKLVKSGAMVKKGELIAEIDGQSMQDHVDDLQDTIDAADADVRKRAAEQGIEWETLQQTLRVAQSEYEKAKLDYNASEVRTDIERQLLKLSLDEAEARLKQQQGDLASKRAAQKAELKILEITRERHNRHRNRHLEDLKRFTIHASMDGLAVMSSVFRGGEMGQIQLGDRVYPGQSFMKVVSPASMQVEASINQAESEDFRLGQEARIHLDAFPGLEFNGKIYSIGALAVGGWRQNYYIRSIPVRIAIQGADPRLIPDLSASADIVVERAKDKTIVPLAAIREENGKTVAYVKNADNFERREVKIGMRGALDAEVISGLRAGDEVRVN